MSYEISNTTTTVIVILVIWEIIWKGLALWRAAQLEQKGWYIAILILNTVGILPIIYLIVSKKPSDRSSNSPLPA